MKWRVMVEITGEDGAVMQHVISDDERTGAGDQPATLGLSLVEGKAPLAGLQRVLVTAQADTHCRHRRRCSHCGASRPLKDHCPRRLVSLFGTVEVRAPRFKPCRCGVACRRTLQVGARLERAALIPPDEGSSAPAQIARAGNDQGRKIIFSSQPAEADRQVRQLQHVLRGLGATATTPVTVLSDGAEGPRSLGASASIGPVRHILDWFHLSMRVQHVAQAVKGWAAERTPPLADTVPRLRWRLWHGQTERALGLIGDTLADLGVSLEAADSPPVRKVTTLLRALETYVAGQADQIIDYAAARRRSEPISTATTESTVQRLLRRHMGANQ